MVRRSSGPIIFQNDEMMADSQELNLYEVTGRALDDIIEGGEDALRRASAANVGGALQRSNSLLAHKNTWKALKDRAIEAKRKVKSILRPSPSSHLISIFRRHRGPRRPYMRRRIYPRRGTSQLVNCVTQ